MKANDRSYTKCRICGQLIRESRLQKHMINGHPRELVGVGPREKERTDLPNLVRKKKTHAPRIVLKSRRGFRAQGNGRCDECGQEFVYVWRYTHSSHGTVHLCGECKPRVFDHSFGKKDALDFGYEGGAFESNRRRH